MYVFVHLNVLLSALECAPLCLPLLSPPLPLLSLTRVFVSRKWSHCGLVGAGLQVLRVCCAPLFLQQIWQRCSDPGSGASVEVAAKVYLVREVVVAVACLRCGLKIRSALLPWGARRCTGVHLGAAGTFGGPVLASRGHGPVY